MNPMQPDLDAFKAAFRRHAAGVAAVTARDLNGDPVGFTATSLASLSAVPPLATFNMARSASSWPAISSTERVAIHMLGARNRSLAEIMSGDNASRFVGDHWHAGENGLPILDGVTTWMTGRIVERLQVHNSVVVVVQIEGGEIGPDDEPLIYHERRYMRPGEIV